MLRVEVKGDFSKSKTFLKKAISRDYRNVLEKYGQAGVRALSSATPSESGKTAASWGYEIVRTASGYEIIWKNSNIVGGVNIAIILQYGHGTRNGGYVQGRDYINPAIRPIFDKMADEAWKVVTTA